MGCSRINNIDKKKAEEFGKLNKVDVSRIKSDEDKRVVLCPMNLFHIHPDNDAKNNDNNTMIFVKIVVLLNSKFNNKFWYY